MTPAQTLAWCRYVVATARETDPTVPEFDAISNFLEGARLVADIVKTWPADERAAVKPSLLALRELEGDLAKKVESDPMILYKPAHEVSAAFHASRAFIRYYRGGNRTSKTQSGYAEHYLIATGQHRFRPFLAPPTASFIIGVNFSKYEPNVFRKKMITGETDNPLSPMFPEGGKWLYKYDDRKHVIYVACVECAEAGRAGSCKHLKSTITLFSDTEGADVLMGGQYNLGHFDEHIREVFFEEAVQRLQTVDLSSLIVTGTPLHGNHAWEHKRLTSMFNKGPSKNRVPGTDQPYVSLHVIDQYAAGLISKENIEKSKVGMDQIDIDSRIYGRPGTLAKRSVFDRHALHEMEGMVVAPRTVTLSGKWDGDVTVRPDIDGHVNIFVPPEPGATYVIGVDVAQGLGYTSGEGGKKHDTDYSCATVLQVPSLKMVAQYHGWVNPVDFADPLSLLGKLYNLAWLVVERNGPGTGTIFTLRNLGYWNLFREITDPTQTEFAQDPLYGVDTNIRTKSTMVAFLQRAVRERAISIPCGETIEEMKAFGEEMTPSGLNVRLKGEGGAHDDRVMSLVFATYVSLAYSLFDYSLPSSNVMGNEVEKPVDPIWTALHAELKNEERAKKGKWY